MKKQMLRCLCLLLSAAVLCSTLVLPVFAAEVYKGICGDQLTWEYDPTTYTLTLSGQGKMADFESPTTPGYSDSAPWSAYASVIKTVILPEGLTEINSYAFMWFNKATEIVLPESLEHIRYQAFYNWKSLTNLHIPKNVKTIEAKAFNNMSELTQFTVSADNPYFTEIDGCIYDKKVQTLVAVPEKMTTLNVPEGVTNILETGGKGLRTLTLPSTLTTISEGAFNYSRVQSVVIPNSVTTIGTRAFYNCTNLSNVTLGNGVEYIGKEAFYGAGISGTITLPASMKDVGEAAFGNTTGSSFTGLIINSDTITVGYSSFGGYRGQPVYSSSGKTLYTVGPKLSQTAPFTIQNGVTRIAEYAFQGVVAPQSVSFPSSLKKIGDYAFAYSNIRNITIPNGITELGNGAFYYAKLIEDIYLPTSLKKIGDEAFRGAGNTTNYSYMTFQGGLPNGLEYIGDHAFDNCGARSLVIPATVSHIGNAALRTSGVSLNSSNPYFTVDNGLLFNKVKTVLHAVISLSGFENQEVTIPEGVLEIAEYAFSGTSVRAVTLPTSLVKIGNNAFSTQTLGMQYSSYLKTLTIPQNSNLQYIGDAAFYDCKLEGEISIPDSVTYVGERAFYYLATSSGITKFRFPKNLPEIKAYVLYGQKYLTDVELPDNVGIIGDGAFYKCNLSSLHFPETLKTIGNGAFRACPALAKVTFDGDECNIGNYAFAECTSLEELKLPRGTIGKYAFEDSANLSNLQIPNEVSLNNYAFKNCDKLRLTLTPKITSVAAEPFSNVETIEYFEKDAHMSYLKQSLWKPVTMGDTNWDGSVDVSDIQLVYYHETEGNECGEASSPLRADLDWNGSISNTDYKEIQNLIVANHCLSNVTTSGSVPAKFSVGVDLGTNDFQEVQEGDMITVNIGLKSTLPNVLFGGIQFALAYNPDAASIEAISSEIGGVANTDTSGAIYYTRYGSELTGGNNVSLLSVTLKVKDQDVLEIPVLTEGLVTDYSGTVLMSQQEGSASVGVCTITHYQQDLAGDGYTEAEASAVLGSIGASVTAREKDYAGFHENTTHEDRADQGTIAEESSLALALYYDRDLHDVTFDSNGGAVVAKQEGIRYGAAASQPEAPEKDGYDFAGWYTNSELTSAFAFTTPVTDNLTLYAAWTARDDTPYTVAHYQQDIAGEGYTLQETENLSGTTDTSATAVAKGYTGFHENTTHDARADEGTIAGDGSLALALYYDRDLYDVAFVSNGGSAVVKQEDIRYGAAATQPEAPEREGYDFEGWHTNSELTSAFAFTTPVTDNLTLYAAWRARTDTTYTVAHYQQDITGEGYTLQETEHLSGTTETSATAVAKGYTGFHEFEEHEDRVASGMIAGDGNLALALYYDRDTFDVSFVSNGGGDVAEQTGIRYGATATEPAEPVRAGYDFVGWHTNSDLTSPFHFTSPVAGDLTLYAAWRARTDTPYTVAHYQQDITGEGYILQETENLSATTDTTATAVAKAYTGFHENTTHEARADEGTIAGDGSLALALYYDRDLHDVIFDSNGGAVVAKQEDIRFEGFATEPEAPTLKGHLFLGWYADEDLSIRFNFQTPITSDQTVYAKWSAISYQVSFDLGEAGGTLEPKNVQFGTEFGLLPMPTYAGYDFTGWYTAAGKQILATSRYETAENTTLYAHWVENGSGDITGDITDDRMTGLGGVDVVVRAGNTDYDQTTTAEDGSFALRGIPYGTYNLVASKDERIVTTVIHVDAPLISASAVLPPVKTNSVVSVAQEAPDIVVGGLNELYTSDKIYTVDDKKTVQGGGTVELSLAVATKEPDSEEAAKISSVAVGQKLGLFLDVEVTKRTTPAGGGASDVLTISETPELLQLVIPIPEELQSKNAYSVLRLHDDEVDTIDETANEHGEYIQLSEDGKYLTLYVRRFSLYAVAYLVPSSSSTTSYTVDVSCGANGAISPTGKVRVSSGSTKTFTLTPAAGYELASLQLDGKSVLDDIKAGVVEGSLTYRTPPVTKNHTLRATFQPSWNPFEDVVEDDWFHDAVRDIYQGGLVVGTDATLFSPVMTTDRAMVVTILHRLAGLPSPEGASGTFPDVAADTWYSEAVAWGVETGTVKGYDTALFGPGDDITREQLVLMLYRYAGTLPPATISADLSGTAAWAEDAMAWAVAHGIVVGNEHGDLMPERTASRAELATVLVRFLSLQ